MGSKEKYIDNIFFKISRFPEFQFYEVLFVCILKNIENVPYLIW
jgi:hypothetical protein